MIQKPYKILKLKSCISESRNNIPFIASGLILTKSFENIFINCWLYIK